MDKVLTRKLFRDKYFEKHKPKTFNKGGLAGIQKFQEGGLTSKEKALYAATFAAPLLQATQAPGESRFSSLARAFGAGVEKLPATILAVEKAKGKGKGFTTLTEEELKQYKLPPGTVAQRDADGKLNIVSKPTSKQLEEIRGYKRTKGLLEGIYKDYTDLDRPVGLDPRRLGVGIGKLTKSGFAKKYSSMDQKIKQATIFLTQAISGAQVSDQERERIRELLPQLGDSETVFEQKLFSLNKYLTDAQAISEANDVSVSGAMEIIADQGGAGSYIDFSKPIKYEVKDGVFDLTGVK
mgnify:FL=1|jgi:hypothetical protein